MNIVKFVTDNSTFLDMEKEWNSLVHRSNQNNFFLTWEWNYFYSKNILIGSNLFIIAIYNDDKLVCIGPFVKTDNQFFNVIKFIGEGHTDYCDVIVDDRDREEILQYLFNIVKKYNLKLSNIPEDSPNYNYLFKEKTFLSYPAYRNPYISIRNDFDSYLEKYSKKKIIQDSKRQLKRLGNFGEIKFFLLTNKSEINIVVDKLIEFKSKRSYSNDIALNPFAGNLEKQFLIDICNSSFEKNYLYVGLLKCNEEIIAVFIGFIYNDKCYYYMPSFSTEYGKYSVGRILLQYAIEDCHNKKILEFDFLNGHERYKNDWATDSRLTQNIIAFHPKILGGIIIFWKSKIKPVLKRNNSLFLFLLRIKLIIKGKKSLVL